MANGKLTLVLLTPDGKSAELKCDSVNLISLDGKHGENGGGIGIHYGHMPAVIALAMGRIFALDNGKEVFGATITGGFAEVKNNIVTVLTESAT